MPNFTHQYLYKGLDPNPHFMLGWCKKEIPMEKKLSAMFHLKDNS